MELVAFQTSVDGEGSESSCYNYFNNEIVFGVLFVAQWHIEFISLFK